MSEKKKSLIMVLLIALLIVLFVVIVVLCITYSRKQNEAIRYYNERIAELEKENGKVEIELSENEESEKKVVQETENVEEEVVQTTENVEEAVQETENVEEVIVSNENEIEAIPSVDEMYEKAFNAYKNPYDNPIYVKSENEEEVYIEELGETVKCVEILNYDDIANEIFSEKGKEELLIRTNIYKLGDKYYCPVEEGPKSLYVSTEFVEVEITNDRRGYNAKTTFIDDEEYEGEVSEYTGEQFRYEENAFILVLENGKWLVEEFMLQK